MADIEFLCLANSKMMHGRCVAGINLSSGSWIRLISSLPTHSYSLEETRLDSGDQIRPLDIAKLEIGPPNGSISQPENVLADGGSWRYLRSLDISHGPERAILRRAMRAGGSFMNTPRLGSPSIPVQDSRFDSSLSLILVSQPTFKQTRPGSIRCYFSYENGVFDLSFTDDLFEFPFEQRTWSVTSRSDWLFMVSLGQPFKGFHWKILAGAIPLGFPWA